MVPIDGKVVYLPVKMVEKALRTVPSSLFYIPGTRAPISTWRDTMPTSVVILTIPFTETLIQVK